MRKLSLTIFFLFAFSFFFFTPAFSQIPHLINYQGKLTDTSGKPVSDGTHSLTFRIYDAESGGNLLWQETQNLLISKGIFSCLLGGVTNLNLPFDKPYWLAIKVGSDSEMTPRQQIASVGYAMRAENVNSLPRGIITMWSGRISDIPSGWALCDGSNGTPNLTDRFVIHADSDSGGINNVGSTGGEHTHTLTVAEMPAHTHTVTKVYYSPWYGGSFLARGDGNEDFVENNKSGLIDSTGGGQSHENRPRYYALAYIMKL